MPLDELDGFGGPPRKWLDKKKYVRVDPRTGQPQLIRIEPVVTDSGEFIPDKVTVYIDDEMQIMSRDSAGALIGALNCTPLEITAQWKHENIN